MRFAALSVIAVCGAVSAAHGQAGNPEFDLQYGLGMVGVDRALEQGLTGEGVPVAVFDTGLDVDHPEFRGRVGPSFDAITQGPVTFDDDEEDGHGTHVAGIIGAARDGRGMMGVAPDVTLQPVRILAGDDLALEQLDIVVPPGYAAALAQGARIINNSWGLEETKITDVSSPEEFAEHFPNLLQSFCDTAEADAVMVWATGNDAFDQPGPEAGLPHLFPELQPTWLAVTSVRPDLALASYANASDVAKLWCLAAPGGEFAVDAPIISTLPGDTYGPLHGTSMAAPHVTGAVAIARQMFPRATGAELASLVLQTATDIGPPVLTMPSAEASAAWSRGWLYAERT